MPGNTSEQLTSQLMMGKILLMIIYLVTNDVILLISLITNLNQRIQ